MDGAPADPDVGSPGRAATGCGIAILVIGAIPTIAGIVVLISLAAQPPDGSDSRAMGQGIVGSMTATVAVVTLVLGGSLVAIGQARATAAKRDW